MPDFEVCQLHGFIEPCYQCEENRKAARRTAELSKASADEHYEFWKRSWQPRQKSNIDTLP